MTMTGRKNQPLNCVFVSVVHDFRTYSIFLGWSCNRILSCPICLKDTTCFHLKFGGRSLSLIVIDVFCPWINYLGWSGTHSRNTILS
jgi:hypothetical protein